MFIGRATHTNPRPAERRARTRGASTVDLIFKCKQIYIAAKAPPTNVIPSFAAIGSMPATVAAMKEALRRSVIASLSDILSFCNHRTSAREGKALPPFSAYSTTHKKTLHRNR